MSHDRRGQLLQEGDIVNIPCRVKKVHSSIEFCNVDLETLYPMPPYTEPSNITINTHQVEKILSE